MEGKEIQKGEKMEMMKKVVAVILSLILVVSTVSFASAGELTDVKTAFLLEKGIPREFIDLLSEEEVSELYEKYQSGSVIFGGIEKETFSFDESTGGMQRGTISSADMTMYVMQNINISSASTKKIGSVDIEFVWEWDTNEPTVKGTDALAANWDPDVFSYDPNSMICYNKYERVNVPVGEVASPIIHETVRETSAADDGGIGWHINLKNEAGTTMMGRGKFTLIPRESMYWNQTDNETNVNINVIYGHNKMPIGAVAFTISALSVTIIPSNTVDTRAVTTLIEYDRTA